MMKKSRLFIALLLMLVAASGFAQDSYREAVKQYLSCSSQLAQDKNALASFKDLFVKDGSVDIDQLTQRYIDERLEDATVDFALPIMKSKGMTEADLLEVASLISTPEGKALSTDQQAWMLAFSTVLIMSSMDYIGGTDLFANVTSELKTVNPDIDAAYAAKFSDISEKMGFLDLVMKGVMKGLNQQTGEALDDSQKEKIMGWLSENAYTMALNSAYGALTPEDLDYAEKLFSYDSYRKLNDNSKANLDDVNVGVFFSDYLNWMKAQGATVDEDSEDFSFMKKIFGLEN